MTRRPAADDAGWVRLDRELYAGPLVRARVHDLDLRRRQEAAPPGLRLTATVGCWALIDTGATHSGIDPDAIVTPLELRLHDVRSLVLAGRGRVETPVHEVAVDFPDFPVPRRIVRVSAMRLPGPFSLLVGMDLLAGTRLELDLRGEACWLRWRPTP